MSDLEQLYQQVILDHSRTRSGEGALSGADGLGIGRSHQVNPTCGDEITVEVDVRDPGARTIRWTGDGCSISMASASVASELFEDLSPDDFAAAEAAFHELMHSRGRGEPDEELLGDGAAFAGVSKFPGRIKCALLAWMAIKDGLLFASAGADGSDIEGGAAHA